jgi:hypothetical protein
MPRYRASRQKVCEECSIAKARCDRKSGGCSRCLRRKLTCKFSHEVQEISIHPKVALPLGYCGPKQDDSGVSEVLDFTNLDLTCPIDPDTISNRWLNTYIPIPGQKIKTYPKGVSFFIHQMLESYISMTTRGELPPFVHAMQMIPGPARLKSSLHVMRELVQGREHDPEKTTDALIAEMSKITDSRHEDDDDLDSLGSFQSYLILTMVAFFKNLRPLSSLREAMTNLQTLAATTARKGLTCKHNRPSWESWAITEAKRRSLYVMYLFDSLLSSTENLPTFLGTELTGLLAPQGKSLWQAKSWKEWHEAYSRHVAVWGNDDFKINELWPLPLDMNEKDLAKLRNRVKSWLEGVDEYGTMMYAVTSITHRG